MTAEQIRPLDTTAHCLNGGTFVSNINDKDLPFMEQAVMRYGDARLILHDRPCLGGECMPGWKSLHWLGPMAKTGGWSKDANFSGVWLIFESIRMRHREWLKLKDFAP